MSVSLYHYKIQYMYSCAVSLPCSSGSYIHCSSGWIVYAHEWICSKGEELLAKESTVQLALKQISQPSSRIQHIFRQALPDIYDTPFYTKQNSLYQANWLAWYRLPNERAFLF